MYTRFLFEMYARLINDTPDLWIKGTIWDILFPILICQLYTKPSSVGLTHKLRIVTLNEKAVAAGPRQSHCSPMLSCTAVCSTIIPQTRNEHSEGAAPHYCMLGEDGLQ